MRSLKELVRHAEHAGWRVDDLGNAVRFLQPDGPAIILCHKTESDVRAMKNTVARLKRAGLPA